VQVMAEHLDQRARAGGRIVARFFVVCGGLGLFLAIVGLGGSVAYAVRQRTRELGIRAAIGATPAALNWLVLSGALRVAAAGITAGLAAATGLAVVAGSRFSGLDLRSPATLALTAAVLLPLVLVAAAVPGRRAARVSPLDALRSE